MIVSDNSTEEHKAYGLAFEIGGFLHEYFIWAETFWSSEYENKNITKILKHFRRQILRSFDLFPATLDDEELSIDASFDRFQQTLPDALASEERIDLIKQYQELEVAIGEELFPRGMPCDESKKLWDLRKEMFSDSIAGTFTEELKTLYDAVRSKFSTHRSVLFFRLGFDLMRPAYPLMLDESFEIEPTDLDDVKHRIAVRLGLDSLWESAAHHHSGLHHLPWDVDSISSLSNAMQFRDSILKVLNRPVQEFEKGVLGLRLYTETQRVGREGYITVFSLANSQAQWGDFDQTCR